MQWTNGEFVLTTDRPPNALEATYDLLQTTYWSHKRSREIVEKILESSLCFFLSDANEQIGFGRVITDYATTTWIADVVLRPDRQGRGLGSWMMECVLNHPGIRDTQFVLQTGSAHEFYERLGFARSQAQMSTPVDYLN